MPKKPNTKPTRKTSRSSTKVRTPAVRAGKGRPARTVKRAGERRGTRVSAQRVRVGKAPETVALISLGCPKNLVDSEKMLGMLAEAGLTPVSSQAENFGGADAVVVNTCGFLEASKDESLGVIKEAIAAKEAGSVQRVIVAGCLVQRHRAKMLEWAPGIDAMVGVFDRDKIVEAVRGPAGAAEAKRPRAKSPAGDADAPKYWIAGNALVAAKERGVETTGLTVQGKDGKGVGYFEDDSSRLRLTPRHYAYLRISEGCNQNCAFCTIPSIRGKMRSKHPGRILSETRELLQDGAFELLLIGQDTTSYGDDIGMGMGASGEGAGKIGGSGHRSDDEVTPSRVEPRVKGAPKTISLAQHGISGAGGGGVNLDALQGAGLPGLLAALDRTVREHAGAGWVRLMYAYPSNFSDEIIDRFAALAAGGIVLPYLDIPLQHASDRVLSLMRRHVTRRQQAHVIRRLHERVANMAVRTTFISGFPGETEDDHRELLDFVREMAFENVGVFAYSREDGTVAGTMEKDKALAVPEDVKQRRLGEVMELQQGIVFARNQARAAKFDASRPLDAKGRVRGECVDVLIDAALRTDGRATAGVTSGGKLYQGRTSAQAPQIDGVTFVHSREKLAPGELVRCVIVGSDGYDLIARPVGEVEKKIGLTILR